MLNNTSSTRGRLTPTGVPQHSVTLPEDAQQSSAEDLFTRPSVLNIVSN
jgi:hypothetical protein